MIGAVGRRGKSEAVGADYSARMYDTARADAAAMVNLRTGIHHRTLAQSDTRTHISLGIDLDTLAEAGACTDVCKCADVCVGRHIDTLGHIAGLLHTRRLRGESLRRKLKQARQSVIRVVDTYHGGAYRALRLEIAAHQHHRCLRVIYMMCIFWIGKEGDGVGTGLLDFCES